MSFFISLMGTLGGSYYQQEGRRKFLNDGFLFHVCEFISFE